MGCIINNFVLVFDLSNHRKPTPEHYIIVTLLVTLLARSYIKVEKCQRVPHAYKYRIVQREAVCLTTSLSVRAELTQCNHTTVESVEQYFKKS